MSSIVSYKEIKFSYFGSFPVLEQSNLNLIVNIESDDFLLAIWASV